MRFISTLTQFLGAGGRRFESCCSDHLINKGKPDYRQKAYLKSFIQNSNSRIQDSVYPAVFNYEPEFFDTFNTHATP